MPSPAPRRRPHRHLVVWLLSAALLVPVAQTAAMWHVVSLVSVDRSDAHGKPFSHPAHCDLCLTAAGLSSGGAPGAAAPPTPPAGLHEAPPAVPTRLVSAPAAWAYRSRAPPSAST